MQLQEQIICSCAELLDETERFIPARRVEALDRCRGGTVHEAYDGKCVVLHQHASLAASA